MNDIFISYRREGGSTTARLICKMLEDFGFRCFFDSESLSYGSFAENIKDNLENSRNFLLILTPGALDRCQSPTDWVRQEIEIAITLYKAGKIKRIIPLFTNGVTGFPENLPTDIKEISEQNAIELNHKDFDSNLSRLRERIHHEKRDQLINYFLDLHEEYDANDTECLDLLLQTFTESLSKKEQLHALKNSLKLYWNGNVSALLEKYDETTLRDICAKFSINEEGGHEALINNIDNWLSNKMPDDPRKVISNKILECYLQNHPGLLSLFCDQLELKEDKRSPQKMRNALAGRIDLELDFNSLSVQELKSIGYKSLGEDKVNGLKRKELLNLIHATYVQGRQELDN